MTRLLESLQIPKWMLASVVLLAIVAMVGGIAGGRSEMLLFAAYIVVYLISFEPVMYFHRRGQIAWKNVFIIVSMLYTLLSVAFGVVSILLIGVAGIRAWVMFKETSPPRPTEEMP